MMVNALIAQSPKEIWQIADPLDFAWFAYAACRMQDQYREATSIGASTALRHLMEADVRAQLAFQGLGAFGFQTLPELSDEPVQIPATIFQADAVTINWETSEISGLGRRYESVKVACLIAPANENSNSAQGDSVSVTPTANAAKRRGGRKSNYSQARLVIDELFSEHPAYRSWSAARLFNAFDGRYRLKFTPEGERHAPISERALRDYLARYRRESADTVGN